MPITVSVPSVTGSLNGAGNTVTLDRGQTTTAYVYFRSNGDYTGSATASLENLPSGVSAPNITATVGSGYTSVPLNFVVSSSAVPGTTPAQLIVNAGGVVTRTDVQITVNKPSISVSFANYNSLTVRRGQTQSVNVQVIGQHGFSGSTTISLNGLPSGVTSSPLTLTVTPGTTTSAALAVTASDVADYGSKSVQLVGNDIESSSQAQLYLSVASSVTVRSNEAVRLATANNGLWTISLNGKFVSNGSAYGYNYAIKRYKNGVLSLDTMIFIENGSSVLPLTTPSGDLVVVGGTNVYIIKTDGSTSSVLGDSGTSSYSKVVDAQNRLWYASYNSGNGVTLNTLDLSNGKKNIVGGFNPSDTYFSIFRNASGATLYLVPNSPYSSTTMLVQFDAVTTTQTKTIPLPGISSVYSLAIAQDGIIWGGSPYSSIFRVNADGTLTNFSSSPHPSKIVFDTTDTKVLWGYSDSTVLKMDAITGTTTLIPAGSSISDIAADSGGGIWAGGSEYDSSSGVNSYYLSLIK